MCVCVRERERDEATLFSLLEIGRERERHTKRSSLSCIRCGVCVCEREKEIWRDMVFLVLSRERKRKMKSDEFLPALDGGRI